MQKTLKAKEAAKNLTSESLKLARSTPGFEWFVALYDVPPGTPRSIDELLEQINALKGLDRNAPIDRNLAAANQIIFNLTHGNLTYFDVPMLWEQAGRRVVARLSPYFQAVIEILSKIEFDRLKVCGREQCGNFFYAKPAHKKGCSPECRNVINASGSRALKAERAAQYQHAQNKKRKRSKQR